jgi:hypothetical protein
MLTAIGVLSLMMVFMFSIVGQTMRAWETGRRRMEVSQATRIGMNLLDSELRYAFAGVYTNNGTNFTDYLNTVPFFAGSNTLAGQSGSDYAFVPGSQTIFFISTIGPHEPKEHVPFAEVGYFPAFVAKADGSYNMMGGTYALVRHGASAGVNELDNANYQDFYYRKTVDTNWIKAKANNNNRTPIVDNCIRMSLDFASNNAGAITWSSSWPSQTKLPLGVLVTLLVIDEKSAAKLKQVKGTNTLTQTEIDKATNSEALGPSDVAPRILREGVSVVRRFVPLVNSKFPQ